MLLNFFVHGLKKSLYQFILNIICIVVFCRFSQARKLILDAEAIGEEKTKMNLVIDQRVVEASFSLSKTFIFGKFFASSIDNVEYFYHLSEVFKFQVNELLSSPIFVVLKYFFELLANSLNVVHIPKNRLIFPDSFLNIVERVGKINSVFLRVLFQHDQEGKRN